MLGGRHHEAVDTDDVHPLQDFTAPPGGSTPVGSLAGVVRDQDTGAPLAGALVAFAGHDSGLDEDLATHTAANGSYRIDGVPARTWSCRRRKRCRCSFVRRTA